MREALIQAFNFEFINQTLTGGVQPRIQSYFSNSVLGMTPGAPAEGRERALLEPFAAELASRRARRLRPARLGRVRGEPQGHPRRDETAGGGGLDRPGRHAARTRRATPFAFEILLTQGADDILSIATIYSAALKRLGIEVRITSVDSAQYKQRTNDYDFDMTHYIRVAVAQPRQRADALLGA